ncbi:transporter [Methylobacterium organophilum]|uniref:Transporter n=1 Tax=Methylobacterium organophilum TaxID=410 RepID=A0ABQ4TE77_METOR|nr:transporter [Methylobacterium organophilum]GJE28637.1 hypothetical protein LKMONMHP_3510 [Methylobacterium organophilum]
MRYAIKKLLTCGLLLSAVHLTTPAKAVDLNSMDYIPAPDGTSIAAFYTTFTQRSTYQAIGGQEIKNGTSLDSSVEIFRFVHYMDIGGVTIAPQVLIPVGSLFDAKIGGQPIRSTWGVADLIFAAPVWLVNNQQAGTAFAITPYLFAPVGNYDFGRVLNMGENRWKFDLQAGLQQQFLKDFNWQLAGDVMWYGTNSDALTRGIGRLTQSQSYQFQTWISYSPPSDQTWRFAIGYSKLMGGAQRLDGILNGSATRADQIRFEVSKFVAPDWQILGMVQHDIAASGGFKEDFRGTIRILKLF